MPPLDLDPTACRDRQRRLLDEMRAAEIDLALVVRTEHVQWLTGYRPFWLGQPAAALWADGHCTLACPRKAPESAATDEIVTYEAAWHSTWRNDQAEACAAVLRDRIAARPAARRAGVEYSACGPHFLALLPAAPLDIEPQLVRMRRRKHADELALLRKAIAATGRMYQRAREIVRPGLTELEMFAELQAAAEREFGEPALGSGNDFQCGSRGGPPRPRAAQEGELWILDLGPGYRGYYGDTCRTLCVGARPSEAQHQAWEAVAATFPYLEQAVRPGTSCRAVFDEVQRRLDAHRPGSFNHHLGHGFGLAPHEGPHLNPRWDDRFEAGDVFTAEPGLYGPDLRAGLRLENDYLVTETGVELLSDFPLEM
jgi:Xaa-Pro aminopeptidase